MSTIIKINIRKSEKNINDEYSMFLSFPYNEEIISCIRSMSTRFFNPDTSEWEIPVKCLHKLVALQKYEIEITGKYVSLETKTVSIPDFKFKTQPFKHQREAFEFGMTHDNWLLGDEMGAGKTKQSIDIAVAKKQQLGYKHCLIICGVNALKWNWVNEIHTHSDEEAYIIGQRTRKGKISIGGTKERLADLSQLETISAYFIITNIESLRNEKIALKLAQLANKGIINMCIADEAHKMKNPSSQQGKGFLKVKPECKIAMTGTPIMNQPLDLYIILRWLGFENHNFYAFKNHYCIMGGFGGYQIVGYKNMTELQERLNDIMLRRLKSDIFDLPEKTYVDEYVEMTPKQQVIYDEIQNELMMNIDKIVTSNNPLSQLIRLRQTTGWTGILSSNIEESAKMDRMLDIVEEATSNGRKVVIFSNWTQITDVAYKLLKPYNPALITGQTKDNTRIDEVNKFQNDDTCKVIIGTTGAMGTGITLTAGTVEIFLDEPWTKAAYEQAVDRCHRIGQTENITIYNLLCQNTIDCRIHDIVIKKGIIADAIVDGKIDAKSREELVHYLLS